MRKVQARLGQQVIEGAETLSRSKEAFMGASSSGTTTPSAIYKAMGLGVVLSLKQPDTIAFPATLRELTPTLNTYTHNGVVIHDSQKVPVDFRALRRSSDKRVSEIRRVPMKKILFAAAMNVDENYWQGHLKHEIKGLLNNEYQFSAERTIEAFGRIGGVLLADAKLERMSPEDTRLLKGVQLKVYEAIGPTPNP